MRIMTAAAAAPLVSPVADASPEIVDPDAASLPFPAVLAAPLLTPAAGVPGALVCRSEMEILVLAPLLEVEGVAPGPVVGADKCSSSFRLTAGPNLLETRESTLAWMGSSSEREAGGGEDGGMGIRTPGEAQDCR